MNVDSFLGHKSSSRAPQVAIGFVMSLELAIKSFQQENFLKLVIDHRGISNCHRKTVALSLLFWQALSGYNLNYFKFKLL